MLLPVKGSSSRPAGRCTVRHPGLWPGSCRKRRDFCRFGTARVSLLSYLGESDTIGGIILKLIALLIFIAVYALMLLLPTWRAAAALAAAAAFVLIGIVPVGEVAGAVDWNVLLMLAGTMGTVDLFIRSNMAEPPVRQAGVGAAKRKMAHHRAGAVCGTGLRLCR